MSTETDKQLEDRYHRATHAMQTGVALDHGRGSNDGEPKHLRVGVNVALVDHGALVGLLIEKGVITRTEYLRAVAEGMEAEVRKYRELLGLDEKVKLG